MTASLLGYHQSSASRKQIHPPCAIFNPLFLGRAGPPQFVSQRYVIFIRAANESTTDFVSSADPSSQTMTSKSKKVCFSTDSRARRSFSARLYVGIIIENRG